MIIPLIIALFFLIQNRINRAKLEDATSTLVFNSMTQKWEKQLEEEVEQKDRQSILSNLNREDDMGGLYNPTVFKGYFDRYDEKIV